MSKGERFNLKGRKCEYIQPDPPNVACRQDAVSVLRQAGMEGLRGWQPVVCMEHRTYLLSEEVRANGRIWEVLHDV